MAEPGGATAFVLGFAVWLKEQGAEVTVVAGEGRWLFEQCRQKGIRAIELRHMRRAISPLSDLRAVFELRRVFKELKPDAVHLNSTKMGAIGSAAARLARVPRTVYRIGGWVFLEPLRPSIKLFYRWIERVTARWKDVIVCVHPGDKIVAERAGIKPRVKIEVIPNGIDMEAFVRKSEGRESARQRLGVDGTAFVFGTIAHYYPPKDLPRYIEACATVSRAMPKAKFIIVGEGPERTAIENARDRLGLHDEVMLTGNVDGMPTLLRAFDVFVLPSAKEGMSWALLEAMAAGLPCVATDVGANRWMLEPDAGWTVPPRDTAALANAMIEAAQNRTEGARRGRTAQNKVREQFPLEKTYQENARALAATPPNLPLSGEELDRT